MSDIELFRGDDFNVNVTIKDADDVVVDLTGWKFKSTVKKSYDDSDRVALISIDIPALSGAEAEQGSLNILLTNAVTTEMEPGDYVMDIQAEYLGSVSTVFSGTLKIKPDVTRRVG